LFLCADFVFLSFLVFGHRDENVCVLPRGFNDDDDNDDDDDGEVLTTTTK